MPKQTYRPMKKISFIAFSIFFLSFNSYSQIQKGTIYLGGSTTFAGNNILDDNRIGSPLAFFRINASTGYFIKDNLVIGLNPGFTIGPHTTHSYDFSPFIRKYKKINENWFFYLEGIIDLRHQVSKSKYDNFDSNNMPVQTELRDRVNFVGLTIAPGITYFIRPKIALEAHLAILNVGTSFRKYSSITSFQTDSKTATLNYNFNVNLSTVNLGIVFYLHKSEKEMNK